MGLLTTNDLLALGQGEHLCLVYEDDPADQLPALAPFIREGVDAGERCVYLADDIGVDVLTSALATEGIDGARERERGVLWVLGRRQWRQPGPLDSARKGAPVLSDAAYCAEACRART